MARKLVVVVSIGVVLALAGGGTVLRQFQTLKAHAAECRKACTSCGDCNPAGG